ncbi:MAG TPA: class II aldolase/adducin family protein [Chitinophagales bacterium]|nr:class II aldolase/adducin family protein [Chitinophagales bacterium]HMW13079.1 class II aldolase/adducin family protein [Chitinophagales bacterium]HMX60226.1 class II aldolase/adducin family protein [Chitinophagales bacterium]HMY22525.1 class II aldolase/adducin family protein [Chitinophagales bacterium]HMZ34340.1 class II aldolase/adducin family protein [Chitinophagales bacterium]
MNIEQIKEEVCNAGKRLLKEGLVARTWGNVSIKVNDTQMVITPSGRPYDELTPNEMVLVDFHTLKFDGNIKPSSELKLHCEVYKTRPHIKAVIHTHQMYASIVAAAQKDVMVLNEEHQKILGAKIIKAAPYALPNTKKITVETARAIEQSNAALMSNHGVVCIGEDLEKTFEVARTLEHACALFIESKKKSAC